MNGVTAPQGAAGRGFRLKAPAHHIAVLIAGLPVREPHAMDHSVAVIRIVITAERRKFRVWPIAQINTAQIVRDFADHWQVQHVDLAVDRGKRTA